MKTPGRNKIVAQNNRRLLWKSTYLLLTIVLLSTTISFSKYTNNNWSEWTLWKISDCYNGINYRCRENRTNANGKNQVQIEIKNTYSKEISIYYFISNQLSDYAVYSIDIKPGGIFSADTYVETNHSYYLLLDKLKFEGEDFNVPYHKCDR
jgi:hypothetical protein